MSIPAIPNLAAHVVEMVEPWKFQPQRQLSHSRAAHTAWSKKADTRHCFFSGFVGVNPAIRISKASNAVHSIVAIVADYDAIIREDEWPEILIRAHEFPPNWISRTFSGGARCVWLLDEPVLVPSTEILVKALGQAIHFLGLRELLPGFDEKHAFLSPQLYYDVGTNWTEVDGSLGLSRAIVEGWIYSASESFNEWEGDVIPIEDLEPLVHAKFPGRWQGPFELGARGIRFWDDFADNTTAAIVRPTGMQCFTGPIGFVPWWQIFGKAFVESYVVKKLSSVVDGIWYDGKAYWYVSADKKWEARNEREIVRWLKVERGLSAQTGKKEAYSEVDKALTIIDQYRRVVGAAPFVFAPAGMIEFTGKRILNTARVAPMLPTDDQCDWGENFPWIAGFLTQFFETEDQLLHFLSWLHRFYMSALLQKPTQGQALFIAGPPNRGKTLLSNRIISQLVGGHQDAAHFLLGLSSFNKELFHHGLWTVDDATPGDTAAEHKRFSTLLKKVTANTTFEYHAKFQDAVMVEWTGRVIITGNLDAESLRILPDLDTSILDKIMLFKASENDIHFPDRSELQPLIVKELPFFASWLRSFEILPEYLSGNVRYGVKSYYHPDLQQAAGESTDAAILGEILESFMRQRYKDGDRKPWCGLMTHLMQDILMDDSVHRIIGRNSAKWFSIQLGKLEAQGRIVTSYRESGKRHFVIQPIKS